ncbi:hypothetical protein [Ruegeria marisrubri]|nr:hypothetical protein [Ruegeria marisrubri]
MIDMIVRIVFRKLINRGIDKGIDLAAGMTSKTDRGGATPDPEAAKRQKQTIRQAQRTARQLRRFTKL